MFFANEQRDNVREENPGISFGMTISRRPAVSAMLTSSRNAGQVGKVLGERWKALSTKQREPYEAKAKTDKQRYEDEKASYNVCISVVRHCWRFAVPDTLWYRPAMKRKTKSRLLATSRRPNDSLTVEKGTVNPCYHMVVSFRPLTCFPTFLYNIRYVVLLVRLKRSV